jgi:hypothetical protein
MSALQLCNTRPRATPTIVPADPSGRVGPFVCEPTVYDLPHLGHARAYTLRLPRPPPADPRLRRHVRAEHHRHGRQDRSLGARAADRRAELAPMYERAYLDDMRALRNDSVDVYARAGDDIDRVISHIERLQQPGATPSGRAVRPATGRDQPSLGRFDGDQLAPAELLPCRRGVCSGAGCGCSPCVRRASTSRGLLVAVQFGSQPAREVAADAVPVGECLDTSRRSDYAGPRCVHALGAFVTCQVGGPAPPRTASRSSQARSHRRHSSADRRQCSW